MPIRPNMIYEMKTSKAALAALPRDALAGLLLGGHIVNEINTLIREFILNLKYYPDDPTSNVYAGIHHFTIMRLLVGKVTEGLEVIQTRVLGGLFARDYLPLIEQNAEGREVVAQLRRKMNNQGLLRRLRSQHVFHNPDNNLLLTAFDALAPAEDWRMLLGPSRQSVRFPMSHAVLSKSLLDATGRTDIAEAVWLIRDEVLDTGAAVTTLFEHMVMAFARRWALFQPAEELKDISGYPHLFAFELPALFREPTPEEQAQLMDTPDPVPAS